MRLPRGRLTMRRIGVAFFVALALAVSPAFWWPRPGMLRLADLPAPREVELMQVSLWGEQIGRKDLTGARVRERDFPTVLRCLSPAESSPWAGKMMAFPPLGEIRIKLKGGRERRVVFVFAGKNPLCFTLDGVPYLRGGGGYRRYLADHRDFYGLPYEHLDEAVCLADKLVGVCLAGEPPR